MKFIPLIIFLLIAFEGFGQKKKKQDPKDIKIDSLAKVNSSLSVQLVFEKYGMNSNKNISRQDRQRTNPVFHT